MEKKSDENLITDIKTINNNVFKLIDATEIYLDNCKVRHEVSKKLLEKRQFDDEVREIDKRFISGNNYTKTGIQRQIVYIRSLLNIFMKDINEIS